MKHVIGFILGLIRTLALTTVFHVVGLMVLKLITLGRYRRLSHLNENQRQGFTEFDLVTLLGFLSTLFLALLVSTLMR